MPSTAPASPGASGGTVLLVSMPFSAAHYPNLALGLLKPAAEAAGARCEVRYFSLDYIDFAGAETYALLTEPALYMAHIGEWVFAPAADPRLGAAETGFLTEVLAREFPAHYTPDRLFAYLAAREAAPAFIERCLAAVDWSGISIVGFTSSFQQTNASLALARRIKAAFPHVLTVFGGANCQDEMGIELHRQFDFIDAVCLGEGDIAFPELVRRHLAGEKLTGIPAIVAREAGVSVVPARTSDPVTGMDALPLPDFDDFFAQHAATEGAGAYPPAVVFETARGCWWGARQHCTFCGLNGVTMSFRAKSPARAFEELRHLVTRHACQDVANADNILDMRYFAGFLPRLAEAGLDLRIYYEVKANLKPWQIALLSRAGVKKIQAGIETLETGLLRLMRKGSTALLNVQVLKLAAEAGIYVEWLALRGFPGESAEQYRAIARLIPALAHLQPPAAFLAARADRFSPYFRTPEAYGVTLEPLAAYRHIFAAGEPARARLAYHFVMHGPEPDGLAEAVAACGALYDRWRARQGASALWCEEAGDALIVHDERDGWPRRVLRLSGTEAALLRAAPSITPWRDLAALPDAAAAAARLEAAGLLLREDGQALALPLRQPGHRRALSWEEIRAGAIRPFLVDAEAARPAA